MTSQRMPHQKCTTEDSHSNADDNHCRNLPAELRIDIYKYYLSEEKGIKLVYGRDCQTEKPVTVSNDDTNKAPINQLQYVCRQLRKEAAGLEVKYNNVELQPLPGMRGTGIEGLYMFAKQCSPEKLNWLTHISISPRSGDGDPPDSRFLLEWLKCYMTHVIWLLEFGAAYPQVRTDFRVPYLTYERTDKHQPGMFMRSGLMFNLLFRDAISSSIQPLLNAEMCEDVISRRFDQNTRAKLLRLAREAPNLRLFPTNIDTDADCFAPGVEDWPHTEYLAGFAENDTNSTWVSWVTRWASEGI